MSRPPKVPLVLVAGLLLAMVAACSPAPDREPSSPTANASGPAPTSAPTPTPTPTPAPVPGHEVYGYVPYWEMDGGIAAHLRGTALTTLALFSVTTNTKGALNTKATGYRRIVGDPGRQVIREARERGVRVEVVFTSFGRARNRHFFEDRERQDATIASLVALTGDLGLDGVNVDVEILDADLVLAYGAFVGRLRTAVLAADAADRVTVATGAGATGAAMAASAAAAGADRLFLMGYDYHYAGSEPGASAPLGRRDGSEKDLPWSLDLYEALGVPVERTILGLPLYGVTWPVVGPELGAPSTGTGAPWILRRNKDVLLDGSLVPIRDEVEMVEQYAFASDGSSPSRWLPAPAQPAASPTSPAASKTPAPTPDRRTWTAVYVDSPETLAPKLALANARGLAGAGFWAIGYERGLPGYTALIAGFAAGESME